MNFSNGIFQGDSISNLLFILSLNPLSYMLGKLKGYNYGNDRRKTITHNFLSTTSIFTVELLILPKKQLDLVTQFSKDICMDFGTNKFAYLKIVKGMIVSDGEPLVMNNLTIKPVKEDDTYKYLGIDEKIVTMDQSKKKEFRRNMLLEQGKYGLLNSVHTTK